jgi:DnaJ-class molecular chaperone
MNNPFEVLGVPKNASCGQIHAAYMRLVKELHPDGHHDSPERGAQEERLKQVNAAYEQLKMTLLGLLRFRQFLRQSVLHVTSPLHQ